MNKYFRIIFSTGLAMFSMFFGAGNVVFPLDVGRIAGNMNFYAVSGLLITAVLVPFIGLFAMFLFEGDYEFFFQRIGKTPGFLVITFLMCLVGPFMAMPRCITLSFSTLNMYFSKVSLFYFSLFACIILYILTQRRNKILAILGNFLSPLLIGSLVLLIIKGFINHPVSMTTNYSASKMFWYGLKEGYYTMDLLGAFFFSVVILIGLKRALGKNFDRYHKENKKKFFSITLISSIIGAFLLGAIYVGFSYVTSFYGNKLGFVAKDTILSIVSFKLLGPIGGIIANLTVCLACLTTAMTLAAVFSEFIQNEIFKRKINYKFSLIITLILAFAMSNLGFMGIIKMSKPILLIGYPVLIVLTVLNLINKIFGFKYVKIPVLVAFIISLIFYFV